MPCYIFVSAMAYELNLCIVLASGFSWWQACQLLLFDLVENAYHGWSLYRLKSKQPDGQEEGRGRLLFIMTELLIREWIEVAVSGILILVVVCVRYANRRFNGLVCDVDDENFRTMVGILVVDFGTEVLVAALTYAFLVSNGFVPLRVLRGVAGVYHKFFMPMAAVVWLFLSVSS